MQKVEVEAENLKKSWIFFLTPHVLYYFQKVKKIIIKHHYTWNSISFPTVFLEMPYLFLSVCHSRPKFRKLKQFRYFLKLRFEKIQIFNTNFWYCSKSSINRSQQIFQSDKDQKVTVFKNIVSRMKPHEHFLIEEWI